jgi:hypothetical protein
MALPEKMSSLQTALVYGGLGLAAVLGIVLVRRESPCGKMRRSFESDFNALLIKSARRTLEEAKAYGCAWPKKAARESGLEN